MATDQQRGKDEHKKHIVYREMVNAKIKTTTAEMFAVLDKNVIKCPENYPNRGIYSQNRNSKKQRKYFLRPKNDLTQSNIYTEER